MKINLLYIVSHPIQYQAPLLRLLAKSEDMDITTVFYWDRKTEGRFDVGFGQTVKWDVPLLSGYAYFYLSNQGNKISALWKIMSEKQYDIVWTHGYTNFYTALAIFFAKLKKYKVFVRGESTLFPDKKPSLLRKLFFTLLNPWVDRYLAIGTNNKNYYLKNGIPENKIYLCHYSVDNHFFREKFLDCRNKITNLKKSLNLNIDHPIILYASKFITRKYPIDLLKAHHVICQNTRSRKPYLIFIGTGETWEAVRAYASSDTSFVRFLGFKNQSELPAYFSMADIFVLPAMHENWGLVINEAMNAECAIVVSDHVGCAIDLVQPNVNGFIYPARNIQILAHYLQILSEDHALCETMKKKSADIVTRWGLSESITGLRAACLSLRLAQNNESC